VSRFGGESVLGGVLLSLGENPASTVQGAPLCKTVKFVAYAEEKRLLAQAARSSHLTRLK